jgi:thiol-disulfide isomerase/thioredoxin
MKIFSTTNYKDIASANKISLIFFTSSDCHLCVKLKPILKKLEKQYRDVDFYICDINKEKELTKMLVKDDGVPTGFVMGNDSVFKIKDPREPDNECWYSKKYLEELIEALLLGE